MSEFATRTSAAALQSAKRLVIKAGSAIICGSDGSANTEWLKTVAADIASLRDTGTEVVVVTSGAVALGHVIMKGDRVTEARGHKSSTSSASPRRIREIGFQG